MSRNDAAASLNVTRLCLFTARARGVTPQQQWLVQHEAVHPGRRRAGCAGCSAACWRATAARSCRIPLPCCCTRAATSAAFLTSACSQPTPPPPPGSRVHTRVPGGPPLRRGCHELRAGGAPSHAGGSPARGELCGRILQRLHCQASWHEGLLPCDAHCAFWRVCRALHFTPQLTPPSTLRVNPPMRPG